MTTANELYQAANQKFGFEVVVQTEEAKRLRVVGRIRADNDGRNMGNWLLVVDRLLTAAYGRPWTVDISKNYFKTGKDKPVVFGWRLIFQSTEPIANHYADIVNLIRTAPVTARTEVTEMPLPGSRAHRNGPDGTGKGVGFTDKMPVGPMAVMRKNAGG